MATCYEQYLNLNDELLNSSTYNAVVPPMSSSSTSAISELTINVVFLLVKFVSLTSDTRTLSVEGAVDMLWEDDQLSWDTSTYPCVTNFPFVASSVWHPYIFLQGSANSQFRFEMDDNDIIYRNVVTELSNGRIYGMFQSSCTMNFLYYPFDSQVCYLKFVNYDDTWITWNIHTSLGLYFTSTDAIKNADWQISSTTANTSTSYLCVASGCSNLSVFVVTFALERKTNYYVMNLIAPSVVIWILVALTYMLPTDRGMKVPMTVTLMLTIYTQQKTVTSLLPSASPVPYICQIYLIGLYLSAMSLITAVLTVLMRVLAPALPPSVQRFLITKVGRLCCAKPARVAPDGPKVKNTIEDSALIDTKLLKTTSGTSSPEMNEILISLEKQFDRVEGCLRHLIDMKTEKTTKLKLERQTRARGRKSSSSSTEFCCLPT